FDAARGAVFDVHDGSGTREVEELFGVDLGERHGPQSVTQMPDSRGRGVARIVPAFEGGNQHRPLHFGQTGPLNIPTVLWAPRRPRGLVPHLDNATVRPAGCHNVAPSVDVR